MGREVEIKRLHKRLRRPLHENPYCLTGMTGTGKTFLAEKICTKLTDFFIDGVLFIELSKDSDVAFILNYIASAYKLPLTVYKDTQTKVEIVRRLLAEKQALIIFDNVTSSSQIHPFVLPVAVIKSHLTRAILV